MLPLIGGALIVGVAGILAAPMLADRLGGGSIGIDYLPLRHAAEALLAGRSVFTDPLFVYPPTAAVALLPAALGSPAAGFAGWTLAGIAALLLAAVVIAGAAPQRHRTTVFGIAAIGLLGSMVAAHSLLLGNLSVLLAPVAAGVLLAFRRDRWELGCGLLAASLLVKPLLAPLVLVPVLYRQWRPLLRTMLPAGALLLLAVGLVPGGWSFPRVLRYCLTGTNLHGANAVNNLSLRGWAEWHGAPHVLGVAAAAVALAAVVAAVAWRLRAGPLPSPIWLGAVLMFGTFLAGGISEVHFLLTGYAVVLLFLVADRPPARWFVPGLAMIALPDLFLPWATTQNWLVGAELLLLVVLLLAPPAGRRPASVLLAPVAATA